MTKTEVVFFGSGPVAAKSLELLLKNFDVKAVVTKPKPAHHKGDFPVLTVASKHKLKVYTVSSRKELSELIDSKPFKTKLAILIDFGIIVGQDVIDYFPNGIINSHFSLLPQWRGADPITFALLSGQKQTGVSLMLLVEAMDEGPIIAVSTQELDGTETGPALTSKLIYLSDALLKEQVPSYLNCKTVEQEVMHQLIPDYPPTPSYSRKLSKGDGILDFNKSAEVLEREIRAFVEWPKSRTNLANIDVIITSAEIADYSGSPGKFEIRDKKLIIFCKEKSLVINTIKPAGKKEMTAESFIAGYLR